MRDVEIGLNEDRVGQAPLRSLISEAQQGVLVLNGEDHKEVRVSVPGAHDIWVHHSELERSVRGLASLETGRQITPGDQVQLRLGGNLIHDVPLVGGFVM
jgi:hypothetical protein